MISAIISTTTNEVIIMINIGIDYEEETYCDLLFNQVSKLTQKTWREC